MQKFMRAFRIPAVFLMIWAVLLHVPTVVYAQGGGGQIMIPQFANSIFFGPSFNTTTRVSPPGFNGFNIGGFRLGFPIQTLGFPLAGPGAPGFKSAAAAGIPGFPNGGRGIPGGPIPAVNLNNGANGGNANNGVNNGNVGFNGNGQVLRGTPPPLVNNNLRGFPVVKGARLPPRNAPNLQAPGVAAHPGAQLPNLNGVIIPHPGALIPLIVGAGKGGMGGGGGGMNGGSGGGY